MDSKLNQLFQLLRVEDLVSNEAFLARVQDLRRSFPRLEELREVLLDLHHSNNDEEDE